MNVIGINFSDSSIEAVEMKRGWFGTGNITAVGRAELPIGAISNGIIKDQAAVSKVLRAVIQQASPRPMTAQTISIAIPEAQVFSRVMVFDAQLNESDITKRLRLQLPSYIPFEVRDVAFDFMVLKKSEAATEIMVVAVPHHILKEYQALADAMKLTLSAIELESISSARAVLPDAAQTTSVAVLDIGARTTIVSFFHNRRLRFSFNIPVAGNDFTKQIMKTLKLSEDAAERKKQQVGLQSGQANDQIVQAIVSVLDPIVKKITESIEYYQANNQPIKISQVVLVGGSAELPDIDTYLTAQLGLPCVRGSILPKYHKTSIVDIAEKHPLLFANALGLAIGGVEKSSHIPEINFLAQV